jgi:hypothetical protein
LALLAAVLDVVPAAVELLLPMAAALDRNYARVAARRGVLQVCGMRKTEMVAQVG